MTIFKSKEYMFNLLLFLPWNDEKFFLIYQLIANIEKIIDQERNHACNRESNRKQISLIDQTIFDYIEKYQFIKNITITKVIIGRICLLFYHQKWLAVY